MSIWICLKNHIPSPKLFFRYIYDFFFNCCVSIRQIQFAQFHSQWKCSYCYVSGVCLLWKRPSLLVNLSCSSMFVVERSIQSWSSSQKSMCISQVCVSFCALCCDDPYSQVWFLTCSVGFYQEPLCCFHNLFCFSIDVLTLNSRVLLNLLNFNGPNCGSLFENRSTCTFAHDL